MPKTLPFGLFSNSFFIFAPPPQPTSNDISLYEILYLIFDYPHKHYTFKYFEV